MTSPHTNDPGTGFLYETMVGPGRSKDTRPAGTTMYRAPSGRVMVGVDAAAKRYFTVNSYTLMEFTSINFHATTILRGIPADTTIGTLGNAKLLWFKGTYYLSCTNNAGVGAVYRVADPNVVDWWTWSAALKTGGAGSKVIGAAFNTDGEYLFWGEYGQPTGGPKIYRSRDGVTWEQVLHIADGTNHVHGVNVDPFRRGHVWATFGDAGTLKHMRSIDQGASWSLVASANDLTWQSVQISFTRNHVYFASDANLAGWTAFRIDKETLRPEHLSYDWHMNVPVPGGRAGRRVTDLNFTSGSATMTSATANFTAADVGVYIRGDNSAIQDNTAIVTVVSATQVTVGSVPLGDTGVTAALITGDLFYGAALYGAVDPATSIFYCVAADPSSVGNTAGLFAITTDGGLHLLKVLQSRHDTDVWIANGHGWWGGYYWKLLT